MSSSSADRGDTEALTHEERARIRSAMYVPTNGLMTIVESIVAAHVQAARADELERADALEAMCDRLAGSHVDLQDAIVWALGQATAWRDQMPRTRENNTYPNGRADGVDTTVKIVKAAMSAHLRGEDLAALGGDEQ